MKYVGILALGAVLLVSFGYFTIFGGPENTITPASETGDAIPEQLATDTDPNAREDFAGAGTLASLLERGDSIECQITYIPSPLEAEIIGTFFVADGKVRADFLTPSPDLSGQVLSSLIYDTQTMYVWSEINGEQYGFSMVSDAFINEDANTPVPADTEVQYNCLTWPRVDNTIFEVPGSVLFTDMTDVQAQFETGTIYEDPEVGEF